MGRGLICKTVDHFLTNEAETQAHYYIKLPVHVASSHFLQISIGIDQR